MIILYQCVTRTTMAWQSENTETHPKCVLRLLFQRSPSPPSPLCTVALWSWSDIYIQSGWKQCLLLAARTNQGMLPMLAKFTEYRLNWFRTQMSELIRITSLGNLWCCNNSNGKALTYLRNAPISRSLSLQQKRPIKFLNIITAREATFPHAFIFFRPQYCKQQILIMPSFWYVRFTGQV